MEKQKTYMEILDIKNNHQNHLEEAAFAFIIEIIRIHTKAATYECSFSKLVLNISMADTTIRICRSLLTRIFKRLSDEGFTVEENGNMVKVSW